MSGPHEPVRIDSTQVVEIEREPLFYIDETPYTIPKTIPANITIRYLQDTYDRGQEYALAAAMREVLGADAMEALADSESVTDEHMTQIMGIVEKKLMAQMRKSLGNSRRGRPR
jgi:hypothetical protein